MKFIENSTTLQYEIGKIQGEEKRESPLGNLSHDS